MKVDLRQVGNLSVDDCIDSYEKHHITLMQLKTLVSIECLVEKGILSNR